MLEAESKIDETRNYAPASIFGPYASNCECSNGSDDDGDSDIDYPNDADCQSQFDSSESNASSTVSDSCVATFTLGRLTGTGTITVTKIDTSDEGDLFQMDVLISWQNKNGRSASLTVLSMRARR